MSPITRMHHGTVRIDPTLLDDIDWVLSMDSALPAENIGAVTDRVRAHWAAYRNPANDDELSEAMTALNDEGPHDYLTVMEVDSVQRLRASLTTDGTVDAELLSEVWNLLVVLTLSFSSECGADPCCNECDWCRFLLLQDRVSAVFDRAGFERPAYVDPLDYDPDEVWCNRGAALAESAGDPR